jgi:hypothetical protein
LPAIGWFKDLLRSFQYFTNESSLILEYLAISGVRPL